MKGSISSWFFGLFLIPKRAFSSFAMLCKLVEEVKIYIFFKNGHLFMYFPRFYSTVGKRADCAGNSSSIPKLGITFRFHFKPCPRDAKTSGLVMLCKVVAVALLNRFAEHHEAVKFSALK